jgi:hypothetical protein
MVLPATVELRQAEIGELLQALNDPSRRRCRPSPPVEQDIDAGPLSSP